MLSTLPLVKPVAKKFWKLYNQIIQSTIEDSVRRLVNNTVCDGPFNGFTFPNLVSSSIHSSTTPKLLGMYEKELYPSLEELLSNNHYDRVIDIGAADGFYAVGLAKRIPQALVVAFEADKSLQQELLHVAEANGVREQITLKGFCHTNDLQELGTSKRTLLISDCEGGEIDLMKPEVLMQLGPCDVIVECHDMFVPNCTESIVKYFSDTHEVTVIKSVEKTLSDVPAGMLPRIPYPEVEIEYAIREHRHYTMNWVVARDLQ